MAGSSPALAMLSERGSRAGGVGVSGFWGLGFRGLGVLGYRVLGFRGSRVMVLGF